MVNLNKKNLSLNIINHSSDLKRLPGLLLNNNKLKNLGWNVSTSFIDGIIKTLQLAADYKK